MFLAGVLGLAVLLGLACFALYGSIGVASGGFLRLALGALLTSIMLSVVLSGFASHLLVSISWEQNNQTHNVGLIFAKCVLAAFAQPTVTGIAALAMMLLLAMSVGRVCSLVEDITVLVESHKSFMERSKALDGSNVVVNAKAK